MTATEYKEKTKSQDDEACKIVLDVMNELMSGLFSFRDDCGGTVCLYKDSQPLVKIEKKAEVLLGFVNGFSLGIKIG